jgi:hypothetical protein
VANGRHRKKCIHTLVQDEGTIEGLDNLKNYITSYYKTLFGAPEEGNLFMDESQTEDIPQVSVEENNFLTAEYSEEEVRKLFSRWNTTKHWVLHHGQVSLQSINGSYITLVPKTNSPEFITDFRPISLTNSSLKFLTKLAANRM